MDNFTFNLTNNISFFSLGLMVALGVCLIVSLRIYARYEKLSKQLTQLQNEFFNYY